MATRRASRSILAVFSVAWIAVGLVFTLSAIGGVLYFGPSVAAGAGLVLSVALLAAGAFGLWSSATDAPDPPD